MNTTNADNRGTITRGRNVWRIDSAFVEEVSTSNNGRTGHLLVSYAVRGQNNMTFIEVLRLNVNRNTLIRSQSGLPFCLCDIRPGMWVDAEFSPFMTNSVPPQSNALRIVVHRRMHNPQPPQPPMSPQPPTPPQQLPSTLTRTDRIVSVDVNNSFFITGNPYNMNEQMRFAVSSETVILDRDGTRIPLQALHPGQLVEVTHADFQTMSIPPQTTAYRVQVY